MTGDCPDTLASQLSLKAFFEKPTEFFLFGDADKIDILDLFRVARFDPGFFHRGAGAGGRQ